MKENKFDLDLWKKLFQYTKPHKKYMIIIAVLMILLGIVESCLPLMQKYAIDKFVETGSIEGLPLFTGVYFVFVIFFAAIVWGFIYAAGKVQVEVAYDIRKDGFKNLQNLSFDYYDKTKAGWIMARMTSDVRNLSEILSWSFLDVVWGIALMITMSTMMFILNFKLAIFTMLIVPVLVATSIFFRKKMLANYRSVRKQNSKVTGAISESIMGAKTTKTLHREEQNTKEFEYETGKMYHSTVRAAIFSALYFPIVMTLGFVGTGLVLWKGGNAVIAQTLSYGTLVAFIAYSTQFFEPINQLARILAQLQRAQASAERIMGLIETEASIQDKEEILKKYGDFAHKHLENWEEIDGSIEFKDVTFQYKEGEKVLENFNLKINAGDTIALVGETGSGKSTIVNLACRFYEPQQGKILIDGVDYRERSQLWLQSNLGYVLQSPHLFSGTIIENIAYGKPEATREEIVTAAKLVNAHEFITKTKDGYDTEVGESGNLLSVGQKQLISFARAILADPKIFVLDEATSSVDTETEFLIQRAVDKVLHNRTSFIIAHRLSTIRSADKIIVLRDGKIVESGSHKDLIHKKDYYYRLYTNQFVEEHEQELLLA